MSTDDNDFLAARAMAEFGCRPAFSRGTRVVAAATNPNPATGQTEQ